MAAVEQGCQWRGIAKQISVRTSRGFLFQGDLELGNAKHVLEDEPPFLCLPQSPAVFAHMARVEITRKRLGQRAFAGGFAAKQADAPDERSIHFGRKPLAISMQILPQACARDGNDPPVAVHKHMLNFSDIRVVFAKPASELVGKTV